MSEVARMRKRIDEEREAAERGLYGVASGTARHDVINAKTEHFTQQVFALREAGKEEEAIALMKRGPDEDDNQHENASTTGNLQPDDDKLDLAKAEAELFPEPQMLESRHFIYVDGTLVFEGPPWGRGPFEGTMLDPYTLTIRHAQRLDVQEIKHVVKKKMVSVYGDPHKVNWQD